MSTEESSRELLTFDAYQQTAFKTAIYPNRGEGYWIYPLLGLVGETGEIAEKFKKSFREEGGKIEGERRASLRKEVGDVIWYLSALCQELGFSFGDVAKENLEKIRRRQAEGKLHGDGDDR